MNSPTSRISLPQILSAAVLMMMLLLVACDPALVILVENQSADSASIKLSFDQADRLYPWNDEDTSQTLLIVLDTMAQQSQDFYFGMGHWDIPGVLDSLTGSISRIDIHVGDRHTTYSDPQEIQAFFEQRISPRYKGLIEIVLK